MTRHDVPENRSNADDAQVGRRRVLTVLAVAAPTLAAGCALGTAELPAGNNDPENDGGDDSGTTSDSGPEAPAACTTGVKVGAVGDFVVGQWKKVTAGNGRINVGRDANGLWAYSNTCTHNNSCQIGNPGTTTGGITCPCHGAQFDGDGNVTRGPAVRALANYKVVVCGGDVYVDKTQTVPQGTRTPA